MPAADRRSTARATIVPDRPGVPNLYAARAERMQAEGANPIREFLGSSAGKTLLWLGLIVVPILMIVAVINRYQPSNTAELLGKGQPEKKGEVDARMKEAAERAQKGTAALDAGVALDAVAKAIEVAGAKTGHYPDFVSGSLVGLEPGRDFAAELALFAGDRISRYQLTIDPMTKDEHFVVEAVSRATGETIVREGRRKPPTTYGSEEHPGSVPTP
jgi:hypothetical protein